MAKRMVRLYLITLAVSSFCLAVAPVERIPRVSYVDGDAAVQGKGEDGWESVDINLPVREGDRISLEKDGLLEIEVDDGSFVRMDQFSEICVGQLMEGRVGIELVSGKLAVVVRSDVDYVVQTPVGEVFLQDRGRYRFEFSKSDGTLEIQVREGRAKFVNDYLDKRVSSGRRLVVMDDGRQTLAGIVDREDEFDSWSDRRDSRYASGKGDGYIPDNVYAGAYDLDSYGSWVTVPDYGYCWRPVNVAPDWAPYRFGYWRNSSWGYTWVSYDPWGWLPYHYGRWWYSSSYGWVWLPGSSWGADCWSPSLVRFSWWDNYIGWGPLGPGESCYNYWGWGQGYSGGNYYNTTVVNNYNTFVNSRHGSSVTYVSVDDFRRGRPIGTGVYSSNNLTRGAARSDALVFRSDSAVSRQLTQRDRIVTGAPKVDPMRGASSSYYGRARTSEGASTSPSQAPGRDAAVGSGRGSGGSRAVTVGRGSAGAGGSEVSGSSRGSAGSGTVTVAPGRSRAETEYDSNRGRPSVSSGSAQDGSRSRPSDTGAGAGRSYTPNSASGRGASSRDLPYGQTGGDAGSSGSSRGSSTGRGSSDEGARSNPGRSSSYPTDSSRGTSGSSRGGSRDSTPPPSGGSGTSSGSRGDAPPRGNTYTPPPSSPAPSTPPPSTPPPTSRGADDTVPRGRGSASVSSHTNSDRSTGDRSNSSGGSTRYAGSGGRTSASLVTVGGQSGRGSQGSSAGSPSRYGSGSGSGVVSAGGSSHSRSYDSSAYGRSSTGTGTGTSYSRSGSGGGGSRPSYSSSQPARSYGSYGASSTSSSRGQGSGTAVSRPSGGSYSGGSSGGGYRSSSPSGGAYSGGGRSSGSGYSSPARSSSPSRVSPAPSASSSSSSSTSSSSTPARGSGGGRR